MTALRLRLTALLAVLLPLVLALPYMPARACSPPTLKHIQPLETQPAADLRLIESDARSIVLELNTPVYNVPSRMMGTELYHSVSVPGLVAIGQGGAPALPVKGALLGIPAGVEIEVVVLQVRTEALPGRYRIAPVPYPVVSEEAGWPNLVGQSSVEDAAVYRADRLYPSSPVRQQATQ